MLFLLFAVAAADGLACGLLLAGLNIYLYRRLYAITLAIVTYKLGLSICNIEISHHLNTRSCRGDNP